MRRIFEGTIVPPNESGLASWLLVKTTDSSAPLGKDPDDVTDEQMFGGLEGIHVRVTIETLPESQERR